MVHWPSSGAASTPAAPAAAAVILAAEQKTSNEMTDSLSITSRIKPHCRGQTAAGRAYARASNMRSGREALHDRTRLLAALLIGSALCASPAQAAQPDLRQRATAALAVIRGTEKVPGLHRAVRVQRDSWGVAHIYASDEHDLFFAQGFVTAQDR